MIVGTKKPVSPNFSRHAAAGWNLVLSLNPCWLVKATDMINKLECLLYKEKLRDLWLFSMERRTLRRIFRCWRLQVAQHQTGI